MSAYIRRAALLMAVIFVILSSVSAMAITATAVMRVSHNAEDSVVDVGENLTIDLQISGAVPAIYVWYFNGKPIEGANSRTYTIESAQLSDAGTYKVEAYDENGKMLVSMDFSVRVVDTEVPKAGDNTLGIGTVIAIMLAACAAMTVFIIKKRRTV